MRKVWIDTDMGIDDCLAILYAHNHPEITIKGISISKGNVSLEQALKNYNYLQTVFGLDYPVYSGLRKTEDNENINMLKVLGQNGLGWITPPDFPIQVNDIKDMEIKDTLELIALAPLHNIPSILKKAKRKISHIHFMGGSIEYPEPEFNTEAAPKATNRVLKSGIPITVYTQDVCSTIPIYRLLYDVGYDNNLQKRFVETLLNWYDAKPIFDILAVIGFAHKEWFTFETKYVDALQKTGFFTKGSDKVSFAIPKNRKEIIDSFTEHTLRGKAYQDMTVVSPHIDDAVLSLGGTLLKYRDVERIIINVFPFSSYTLGSEKSSEIISHIRRAEEEKIAKELGIKIKFMEFKDWTLRGYRKWNQPLMDSPELLENVKRCITQEISNQQKLLIPLAVGSCVDHSLIRSLRLDGSYYEDLPYAAYPELPMDINGLSPNPIKITRFLNKKIELLEKYQSQLTNQDIQMTIEHSIHKNGNNYETIWSANK